uniref:Uncharacterized protein n=1 Tax=Candidatus Kentrum sp. FW TaxID=2126338 RepID=A0A450T6P7_9GAMM|nr:MAG: hypothetical protein BECKFW1821C_GA0114237_100239 [Candidatus Kentron sp. FW]
MQGPGIQPSFPEPPIKTRQHPIQGLLITDVSPTFGTGFDPGNGLIAPQKIDQVRNQIIVVTHMERFLFEVIPQQVEAIEDDRHQPRPIL